MAKIDFSQGNFDLAVGRYESILAKDPNNSGALLAIANIKQSSGGSKEDVEKFLLRAVKAAPLDFGARLANIDFLIRHHKTKAAVTASQEAITAIPDQPILLEALGRSHLAAGDTQQAIIAYRKASAAQPASARPLLALASVYQVSRDLKSANQTLRRALEISPGLIPAQEALIQVAMVEGRWEDAVQVAKSIQRERPRESTGFALEGQIRASLREWDLAIRLFQTGLDIDRTTDGAKRLHMSLIAAGRFDDADRFVSNWMGKQSRDAEFLFHVGNVQTDRKNFALAESIFRQVLTLVPDNASAMNNLAWLLLKQGKPGALELAERANQTLPNRSTFLDTLASALAADGQTRRAVEIQTRAVGAAPNSPDLRLKLAKFQIALGDTIAAKKELIQLQQLGTRYGSHAEVAALLRTL